MSDAYIGGFVHGAADEMAKVNAAEAMLCDAEEEWQKKKDQLINYLLEPVSRGRGEEGVERWRTICWPCIIRVPRTRKDGEKRAHINEFLDLLYLMELEWSDGAKCGSNKLVGFSLKPMQVFNV